VAVWFLRPTQAVDGASNRIDEASKLNDVGDNMKRVSFLAIALLSASLSQVEEP
jgi:hypothetical protein